MTRRVASIHLPLRQGPSPGLPRPRSGQIAGMLLAAGSGTSLVRKNLRTKTATGRSTLGPHAAVNAGRLRALVRAITVAGLEKVIPSG